MPDLPDLPDRLTPRHPRARPRALARRFTHVSVSNARFERARVALSGPALRAPEAQRVHT
eukprot:1115534-Prorocentrum_minimum.AAC.2